MLKEVGEPTGFDFAPRDHVELGERLGAIDMERGAKVSGARFYFLRGVGAQLQWALLNLAVSTAIGHGFVPMIPPVLVKPEAMEGTGFLGAHADEVYRLEADDLYLVGTAEVPLAGYHAGEILDLADGPLRYSDDPDHAERVVVLVGGRQQRQRAAAALGGEVALGRIGVVAGDDRDVEDLLEGVTARLAGLDLDQVEDLVLAREHEVVEAAAGPRARRRSSCAPRPPARGGAREIAAATSSGEHFGTQPSSSPLNGCSTSMCSRGPSVRTRAASASSCAEEMRSDGIFVVVGAPPGWVGTWVVLMV